MVRHYPHTLIWQTEGTPAGKDPETGFPVPGVPGEVLTAQCRYENFQKGTSKEYKNKNGETVLQKGTIYVKKGEKVPTFEDTVRVESPEFGVVFEGEILHVYQGQLNSTIAI